MRNITKIKVGIVLTFISFVFLITVYKKPNAKLFQESEYVPEVKVWEAHMPEALDTLFRVGHNIKWDWKWQAAYNDGRVKVLYRKDGSAFGLVLKSSY